MRNGVRLFVLCSLLFLMSACKTQSSPVLNLPAKDSLTPMDSEALIDATTAQVTMPSAPIPTNTLTPLPVVPSTPRITEEVKEKMRISIVFDNMGGTEGMQTSWGYAAVVEFHQHTVLFDTGGDGTILLGNMRTMRIDPQNIEAVVLSHNHQDHTGGLFSLLAKSGSVAVYGLPSFPSQFRDQVDQVAEFVTVEPGTAIFADIFSSGEINQIVPEQALVIQTDEGLVVLTGCAHPGIVPIIEQIRDQFQQPILLAMGGFHLGNANESQIRTIIADLQALGVEKVAPSHCTGDLAIRLFASSYADNFIQAGVGTVIEFP